MHQDWAWKGLNSFSLTSIELTSVNTGEAVVHDKQGITATGFGTNVAATDAMCPPIDTPVTARGP